MNAGALSSVVLPRGWDWINLWAAAPKIQEVGQPHAQPLSVFLDAGVVPRSSRADNHNILGEDLAKYQVVRPGDLVFNKLRTWQGGLGASRDHGIVSPAYFVCRPDDGWDSRYLHFLLVSSPYLAELRRISKFMPPSQFDTPWDVLRMLPVLRPPLAEQRRIADYLESVSGRYAQVQNIRERQLDLLRDEDRAVVDEVFARDVGVERTRLKYLMAVRPRYGVLVPQFVDDGVPFIRVGDLDDLESRVPVLSKIPHDLSSQYPRTVVRSGDLLVSVVGTLGRSVVAGPLVEGANIARAVCSVRVRSGVEIELLQAWLCGTSFGLQARMATSTDTAQPTLGMEDFGNFSIAWPSRPERRCEMLDQLLVERDRIRQLVRRIREQLALLAERRQALITAAVTGQIDVSTAGGVEV